MSVQRPTSPLPKKTTQKRRHEHNVLIRKAEDQLFPEPALPCPHPLEKRGRENPSWRQTSHAMRMLNGETRPSLPGLLLGLISLAFKLI